jgi:hypothetical protein
MQDHYLGFVHTPSKTSSLSLPGHLAWGIYVKKHTDTQISVVDPEENMRTIFDGLRLHLQGGWSGTRVRFWDPLSSFK